MSDYNKEISEEIRILKDHSNLIYDLEIQNGKVFSCSSDEYIKNFILKFLIL